MARVTSSDIMEAPTQPLEPRAIRYNKPTTISFDADTTVSLVIEMAGAGSAKSNFSNLAGPQVAGIVRLSNNATATLVGPPDEVTITQSDPPAERQLMDGVNAQWIWNVRAKRPGSTILTLEIYTAVEKSGAPVPYQIKTYTDRFPVKISLLSWLKWEIDRIDPIWKWFGLGTPVVIVTGFIGYLRRRAKKGGKAA